MKSDIAILFEPEAYSISGPKLMGRNAAGNSFLTGLFKYSTSEFHAAFCADEARAKTFKKFAEDSGSSKALRYISPQSLHELSNIGCLYVPEPGLGTYARQRSLFGHHQWSLCGITHTILSANAMDAITGLLTSPVQPWDALTCTSRAVHASVRTVLDSEIEYLSMRLGATKFRLPKLPIIPLGIDVNEFKSTKSDRDLARQILGIADDETVILYLGRLSFHAKSHPAALYESIHKASEGKKVVLVECGWFANDFIKDAFDEAANTFAPNVRRIYLDGRRVDKRKLAWSCSDIFVSLTDNLQETFGITPVEAMAAGLPVIVTDWDGYRDTIRHGIDGFLIPTSMASTDVGKELARRYAINIDNYDHFCGLTSQLISVDIEAASNSLRALINNNELRKKMGEAGRKRAEEIFDWSKIIKIYEDLWRELDLERTASAKNGQYDQITYPWPARMNPFEAFKSYPTSILNLSTKIQRVQKDVKKDLDKIIGLKSFALSRMFIRDRSSFENLIELVPTNNTIAISDIAANTILNPDQIMIYVAIGLKFNLLKICNETLEKG